MIPRSKLLRMFQSSLSELSKEAEGAERHPSLADTLAVVRRELALADTAISLPSEILSCIFSYLDIHSLISCALVHRSWSTPASYLVWRDVHIVQIRELGWVLAILEAESSGRRVTSNEIPGPVPTPKSLPPGFSRGASPNVPPPMSRTSGYEGTGGHFPWNGKRMNRDGVGSASICSNTGNAFSLLLEDVDQILPTMWFEPEPTSQNDVPLSRRFPTTFPGKDTVLEADAPMDTTSSENAPAPLKPRPIKRLYLDLPPLPPKNSKNLPPPSLPLRFLRLLPSIVHLPNITHLSFPRGLPIPDDTLFGILEQCTALEWVSLAELSVVYKPKLYEILARRGDKLRSLDVEAPSGDCDELSDRYLAHIGLMSGLTHLSIAGHQNLTDPFFTMLLYTLPRLRKIDLTNCSGLSATSISTLPTHCPNIEVLSLVDCPCITTESLQTLLSGLPNLVSLDITAAGADMDDRIEQSAFISALKHKRLTYLGWGENDDCLDMGTRVEKQLLKRFKGGKSRPLIWDGDDMWDLVADPRGIEEEEEEEYREEADSDFSDDDSGESDPDTDSWVDDDDGDVDVETEGSTPTLPPGVFFNFGMVGVGVVGAASDGTSSTSSPHQNSGAAESGYGTGSGMPGAWHSSGDTDAEGWDTD
ncbi:hypothetical protein M427DRAFT_152808 [Gonapodya prolifera JEL478]|uniref:F-box domain-containing protein n=1 Tax=Gonapodya prolifera (strain JEL478) TaxID=1344416 RepID=A0A139APZ2_GONPJ|nr:hypothetical protein M427DRAFT_152808 [Gonapodya prolifera JEL478]|eukprot:KXS18806.1 hypothetical protein M427DRAFT_152808 [Gonapodya prolifera JEL478]